VAATVWACGRRGRRGAVVSPYIVVDGETRRREEAESVVVTAVFGSFAAFWREARFGSFFFVDDMLVENWRSRLFLRSVLVHAKGLLVPGVREGMVVVAEVSGDLL
jgi:hypothetical protein